MEDMRTAVLTLASIATALLFAGQPAQAKAHPRVAGLACAPLAQRVGPANVWRTYFFGERETLFGSRWPFTAAPCFRTLSDCQNWLYWAQTDYPLEHEIDRCRRGLR